MNVTVIKIKLTLLLCPTDRPREYHLPVGAIAGIAVACLILGVAVGIGGSCLVVTKR